MTYVSSCDIDRFPIRGDAVTMVADSSSFGCQHTDHNKGSRPALMTLDHNGNYINPDYDNCNKCEQFFKNGKDFSLTSEVSDSLIAQGSSDGLKLLGSGDGFTAQGSSEGFADQESSDGFTVLGSSDGFSVQGSSGGFIVKESSNDFTVKGSSDGFTTREAECEAAETCGCIPDKLKLQGKQASQDEAHTDFTGGVCLLSAETPDPNVIHLDTCAANYFTDASYFDREASYAYTDLDVVNSHAQVCHILVSDAAEIYDRLENMITSYRSVLSQDLECSRNEAARCKHCGEYLLSDLTFLPDISSLNSCMCQSLDSMFLDDDYHVSMWNWTYTSKNKFNVHNLEPGDYNTTASDDDDGDEIVPFSLPFSSMFDPPLLSKPSRQSSLLPSFPGYDKKQQTLPVVSLFNHSVNFWKMEID
ncbi:hypothetical protein BsWGS_24442 [Bradybaena similaris]